MKIKVKFDLFTICSNYLAEILGKLDIDFRLNSIGEIEILQPLSISEQERLFLALNTSGVEVINDEQLIIVEKIKEVISELVERDPELNKAKFTDYIEAKFPFSYNYLSRIFTETTHLSIEQFLILKKIDLVKELLMQGQLTLTEIAYKLNYSSISHLSKQFKKTTGFSPSYFVKLKKRLGNT